MRYLIVIMQPFFTSTSPCEKSAVKLMDKIGVRPINELEKRLKSYFFIIPSEFSYPHSSKEKALFVNFVAICAKKVSETKG